MFDASGTNSSTKLRRREQQEIGTRRLSMQMSSFRDRYYCTDFEHSGTSPVRQISSGMVGATSAGSGGRQSSVANQQQQ